MHSSCTVPDLTVDPCFASVPGTLGRLPHFLSWRSVHNGCFCCLGLISRSFYVLVYSALEVDSRTSPASWYGVFAQLMLQLPCGPTVNSDAEVVSVLISAVTEKCAQLVLQLPERTITAIGRSHSFVGPAL